jgi:CRISPR/Cas system-associated endonuclease Cas1
VEVLYKHIKCALNEKCSLKYSKIFIESKIHNSKIMLKRWSRLSTTNEKVDDIVKKLEYFYKLAGNC